MLQYGLFDESMAVAVILQDMAGTGRNFYGLYDESAERKSGRAACRVPGCFGKAAAHGA